MAVCTIDYYYGRINSVVCTLLYVAQRPSTTLFFFFACIHGLHARSCVVRQHNTVSSVLGIIQLVFIHADSLLASSPWCKAWCSYVVNNNGWWWPLPFGRYVNSWPYCWQL